MTNQEFLLALRSLRHQYDTQYLTGTEYNRQLLALHADHAAQYLVNQSSAPQVYPAQPLPGKVLQSPPSLTHQQTVWAKGHDWYVRTVLTEDGYAVIAKEVLHNTVTGNKITQHREFRNYRELRAWAGY
ncbi:MAG: hypothetical protein [Bacteriophage sp.]|nr:MAG: hypothetical protein [Bacteriophage sp.]